MSLITNTWRGMLRRKLWPLALLLVGALVAVPMTLAKQPEPGPAVPAATLARAQEQEALAKPIVSLSDSADKSGRRRVLGASKDPFEPAPLPKHKKAKAAQKADATPTPDAAPSDSGAASPPSSPSAPAPSGPAPTATAHTTIPKGSIAVRFGTVDSTLGLSILSRLEVLPSDDNPLLVFERLKDGGRTAVFSIPGEVTGQGDGKCLPDEDNCDTLELRAGDTEFVTITDPADNSQAQYELDLAKIYTKTTVVAKSDR